MYVTSVRFCVSRSLQQHSNLLFNGTFLFWLCTRTYIHTHKYHFRRSFRVLICGQMAVLFNQIDYSPLLLRFNKTHKITNRAAPSIKDEMAIELWLYTVLIGCDLLYFCLIISLISDYSVTVNKGIKPPSIQQEMVNYMVQKKRKGGVRDRTDNRSKPVVQLKASIEPEPKMLSTVNICRVHK